MPVRILLLFALLGSASAATAQDAAPLFAVDVVNVRGSEDTEKTRLDLYTKIPYANLQFLQAEDGFEADYAVTADVYAVNDEGDEERLVTTRVWDRRVRAPSFEATQAKQVYDATTQSLLLSPGQYLVLFQLEDQNSTRIFTRDVAVRVRDLDRPVAVSDIILLSRYDGASNTIEPLVTRRVRSDSKQLALFYETYVDGESRSLTITQRVQRIDQERSLPSVKGLLGLDVEEEPSDLVYDVTKQRTFEPGRTQSVMEVPLGDFQVGQYAVHLLVENEQGEVLDQVSETFSLQWSGLAAHIQSLDEAIDQLQYIAKEETLEWIREAPTEEQMLQRFHDFWNKRDPSPSSGRNERMEEYYYRIASANKEYGSLRDGWRTDRGQVLVLFGEPDHVDRHPFNYSTPPYEIWYYYQVGKRFIFVDKNGFGHFQLMIPIWDERTRIR